MKHTSMLLLVLVAALGLSCTEKVSLFDQAHTGAWSEKGNAQWQYENGIIIGSLLRGTGFLITEETYANFELELEFYPDETINSGVFVRCKEQRLSFTDCYELNIWDHHPEPGDRTGALVSRTQPLKQVTTINQWNTYRIRCEGNTIKAWINGDLVVDVVNEDLVEGYIGLQADGLGMVQFRNVELTKL
jgi:hypothetical protein